MGVSKYRIKKWTKMLLGQSISYVNQDIGKFYKKDIIKGYYNDLTEKVTKRNLLVNELPKSPNDKGIYYFFSIEIFQYGLGAYDLYLQTCNEEYLTRFKTAVSWAIENLDENGGWKTFETKNPYSSMAQGEGISLLLRAFNEFKDKKYIDACKKAMKLMLKPVESGGTCLYKNDEIYLKEFVEEPVVLNGFIFSLFGMYDYLLLINDKKIKNIYEKCINTLINTIDKFDLGYWSKYDINRKIASPFYHNLHVKLLFVLSDLTNEKKFMDYSYRFEKYSNNFVYKCRAFIKKAYQKISE